MLDKLLSVFRSKETPEPATDTDDLQLSIAALLVEAARADETYADEEKAIINTALAAQFELNAEDAAQLRLKGEEAQANAVDLHRFTKRAKDMNAEQKTALIETLWKIVLSDGDRDQYEDALIRRICGLIYVDDRASGEARQRVVAAMG